MAQEANQDGDRILFQIRMEESFKQTLRVEAAKAGKSMSEYVRSTLEKRWNDGGSGPDSLINNHMTDPGNETPSGNSGSDVSGNEGVSGKSEEGSLNSGNGGQTEETEE